MGENRYNFRTLWIINAPIEAVWDVLEDSERWPEWWPYLESVEEIVEGDFQGIGSIRSYTWKGSLPYRIAFQVKVTRIERPLLIEGEICGDIEGVGRWNLLPQGADSTSVEYLLNARSTKTWMNATAPILSWYFRFNHNRVMESGRKGLEIYLCNMEIPVIQSGK